MREEKLFAKYKEDVFRTSYYMLQDYQEAEDLTQDVFIKAFAQEYWEIEHQRAWLLRITVNLCLNHLKRKRRIVLMDSFVKWAVQLVEPRKVEQQIEEMEQKSEIHDLLQLLPIKIRGVIILKYLHQLKNEEIARVLHIPVGTVKSRTNKGLHILRQYIELDTYRELVLCEEIEGGVRG